LYFKHTLLTQYIFQLCYCFITVHIVSHTQNIVNDNAGCTVLAKQLTWNLWWVMFIRL